MSDSRPLSRVYIPCTDPPKHDLTRSHPVIFIPFRNSAGSVCLISGKYSSRSSVLSNSMPDSSSGMKSAPYIVEFGTGVYCLLHHQIFYLMCTPLARNIYWQILIVYTNLYCIYRSKIRAKIRLKIGHMCRMPHVSGVCVSGTVRV